MRKTRWARWTVATIVASAAALVVAAPGLAEPVTFAQIVNATDVVQAGVSGVGSDNSVSVTVSGVSGTVTKALLYYHGIGDPSYAPTGVAFNAVAVTPVNIGDSSTNCWGSGTSTAYRADVTAQVVAAGGNGTYSITNLANGSGLSANGASLIVFFNDANSANNRDVALFEGNDSDVAGFPGDPEGWQATLPGINYSTGSAGATLHVGDGQVTSSDGDVTFTATPDNGGTNPLTFADTPTIFDGVSVPNNGSGRNGHGLWDIHQFDITALFNSTAGTYSVDLTHPLVGDCLALIVLALDFQAGALPNPNDTTKPSCFISAKIAGPPTQLQVTVRDQGSGLASIIVTKSTNATTVVPPFTVGTTDPVVVTATKTNQSQGSVIELRVTDVAGNVTVCDPVVTLSVREAGKPASETYSNVPQAESKITIVNGDPGVNRLDVTVNGKTWKLTGLKANEELSLDVASAMIAGDNNTITLAAHGKPEGSVLVVISD